MYDDVYLVVLWQINVENVHRSRQTNVEKPPSPSQKKNSALLLLYRCEVTRSIVRRLAQHMVAKHIITRAQKTRLAARKTGARHHSKTGPTLTVATSEDERKMRLPQSRPKKQKAARACGTRRRGSTNKRGPAKVTILQELKWREG